MAFIDKLDRAVRMNNSLLCVGLDPDPKQIPDGLEVLDFLKGIIGATSDLVAAYKPNLAFFEALGNEGTPILKEILAYIPPEIPVIGDAKRADIGNVSNSYAWALFEHFNFDAATVNPYLGLDSIAPFREYRDRGVFVLCRTSNPGALDFQSLLCEMPDRTRLPLYQVVARKIAFWNIYGNVGLVIGATYPEELRSIRDEYPDTLLLIPGVGAQGGDLEKTVRYGVNQLGKGAIINSSRPVLYASRGKDFAEKARQAALALRSQINVFRVQG